MSQPVGTPTGPSASGRELKACCATAYSSDIVAALLGESYHPGGLDLTRRLSDRLGLVRDARVLDVACGTGATARLLADLHHARVDGLDYSPNTVAAARAAAQSHGLAERATFAVGDAETLPYPDGVFDAVVCECALCTFPDKPAAAAEFTRVLRQGGRIGITDVTADPTRLPPQLRGMAASIACIADAQPLPDYAAILTSAGLRVIRTERHDTALSRMVAQIEARLALLRITAADRLTAAGIDLAQAGPVLAAARAAITEGTLGYGLLIAEKP